MVQRPHEGQIKEDVHGRISLGIGQSKNEKQDRSTMTGAWSNLNNVFNFALPTAEAGAKQGSALTGAGVEALGGPMSYWSKLLSGNRAAVGAATAPETNAAISSSDAAARQQAAMGTARGGGTAGANQQRSDTLRSQIDQTMLGAQQGAATSEAEAAGTEAGLGLSTTAQANNLLGLGAETQSAIGSEAEGDVQNQIAKAQEQASLFGDITSGLALGLGMAES